MYCVFPKKCQYGSNIVALKEDNTWTCKTYTHTHIIGTVHAHIGIHSHIYSTSGAMLQDYQQAKIQWILYTWDDKRFPQETCLRESW